MCLHVFMWGQAGTQRGGACTLQTCTTIHGIFAWVLQLELRSSYLRSTHFITGLSPQPQHPTFWTEMCISLERTWDNAGMLSSKQESPMAPPGHCPCSFFTQPSPPLPVLSWLNIHSLAARLTWNSQHSGLSYLSTVLIGCVHSSELHLFPGCPVPHPVLNSVRVLYINLFQASDVQGSANSLEEEPRKKPIWTLRNSLEVNGEQFLKSKEGTSTQ